MLPSTVDSFSERLRQYVPVPSDVSPTAASSLAVDIRTFPWIRRLASDYAFAFAKVAPFFAGDPATTAAWADTIKRSQSFTRQPAEIARVIAAQQAARNAPAAARESAARLADPATRVVITGQQAGLFGGPLFTLLKAVTTMKLAAEVSREHRVPVVPVFWIDAEDHDWPEVSGCTVLDSEFAPATVRLEDLPGAGSLPIARLTLNDAVQTALDHLHTSLPDSEFKAELMAALRAPTCRAGACPRPSACGSSTCSDRMASSSTTRQIRRRNRWRATSSSRRSASPVETARIAAKAGGALVAKGYHAQASRRTAPFRCSI